MQGPLDPESGVATNKERYLAMPRKGPAHSTKREIDACLPVGRNVFQLLMNLHPLYKNINGKNPL